MHLTRLINIFQKVVMKFYNTNLLRKPSAYVLWLHIIYISSFFPLESALKNISFILTDFYWNKGKNLSQKEVFLNGLILWASVLFSVLC